MSGEPTFLRPRRANLSRVLGVLTEHSQSWWDEYPHLAELEIGEGFWSTAGRSLGGEILGLRGLWLHGGTEEAWEALSSAGLIPQDWVQSPSRWFVMSGMGKPVGVVQEILSDGTFRVKWRYGTDVGRWSFAKEHLQVGDRVVADSFGWLRKAPPRMLHRAPPSFPLLVALASDVPGILAAEAILRDCYPQCDALWGEFGDENEEMPDSVENLIARSAPCIGYTRAVSLAKVGYGLQEIQTNGFLLLAPPVLGSML